MVKPRVVAAIGTAVSTMDGNDARGARIEQAAVEAIKRALDAGITNVEEQRKRIVAAINEERAR